jgi:hypothetical protein
MEGFQSLAERTSTCGEVRSGVALIGAINSKFTLGDALVGVCPIGYVKPEVGKVIGYGLEASA